MKLILSDRSVKSSANKVLARAVLKFWPVWVKKSMKPLTT